MDCHRIQPDPDNNRIILYNDCVPCCDCEDYANVTKALESTIAALEAVRTQFLFVVGRMNGHITEYNQDVFPKVRTVGAMLYLMKPSDGFSHNGGDFDGGTFVSATVVLVNRASSQVNISGTITFSSDVILRKPTHQGKEKLLVTINTPTQLELSGIIKPNTELRTHMLLTADTTANAQALGATMFLEWDQFGQNKNITVNADDGEVAP